MKQTTEYALYGETDKYAQESILAHENAFLTGRTDMETFLRRMARARGIPLYMLKRQLETPKMESGRRVTPIRELFPAPIRSEKHANNRRSGSEKLIKPAILLRADPSRQHKLAWGGGKNGKNAQK